MTFLKSFLCVVWAVFSWNVEAKIEKESEAQKILDNIEHLIQKLPDQFDFYKYKIYKNSPEQSAQDFCLYDWNGIGQDYQQKKLGRADLYLFNGDENKECRFFPNYQHWNSSPQELFIYQAALMKTFGDQELIRLMQKCQANFHDDSFYGELNSLPKDRLHAYIDDCLDHGVPFQIWNGAYSTEEEVVYSELSNYITTKFLVSSDRLLNAIMYSYTSVFSVGTSSILYDKGLTDKVFEIDENAINLSLAIIYNIVQTKSVNDLSQESRAKLDKLAFSIIRRFPESRKEEPPPATNIPGRIIGMLIANNYYSYADGLRMSEDDLLLRVGYLVDMDKHFGDFFKQHKAYEKALNFYRRYREYQETYRDFYYKDLIDANICLSALALGQFSKDCVVIINNYITQLIVKLNDLKRADINSASIRDLAKLTVLQQDTINLNAKIRQYLYVLIGLSTLMASLIFFLFRIQQALRRKNFLIAEQKAGLEQSHHKIQEQRNSIQLILDEIADVILKFDRNGQIMPYSSKAAIHLFGQIDDLSIFQWVKQYFHLAEDEIHVIQEVLRSVLNEPAVSWDLNSSHLPHEVELCGLSFAIEWTPIFLGGVTHEILISAHSLSHLREVEALRAEQNTVLALVQGGSQAMPWVRTLPGRLAELSQLTSGEEFSRRLHTIKGEARTLSLAPIVAGCHRLEQILRDGGPYLSVLEQLQQSAALAQEVLSKLEQSQSQPIVRESIFDIVQRIKKEARQSMSALGFQLNLALTLNGDFDESPTQELLGEILLHAINNSLDHGFVRPQAQGQKPNPNIQIDIQIEGPASKLRLHIADNGLGLDEHSLRELARTRHWQPEVGRPWTDIVFESGVSTATDAVTDRSGRGVGLSAIKQAAQELGLRPSLQSRSDGKPGTLLVVE